MSSILTIDSIVVGVYLIAIIIIGIFASTHIKSLRDYSTSNRKYGAFVLMATLSASFIGGGFSTGNASKVATLGIGNILALCGFSISIFIVGKFIVPKIKPFEKAISCGEIMKAAYGKRAQLFTGIFGMLLCAGILGAQIGAIGYIFNIFLGLPSMYGIMIGFGIVLFYSTIGGMRSIVATDVIQFVSLGIGMPLLLFYSIRLTGGVDHIIAETPPELFHITNGYSTVGFISLFLTLALGEALVPPYVQRLLMGRNLKTTSRGTIYSSLISVPFFIITGLIGLVGAVYFAGTEINTDSIMQSMIKVAAPVGIKGIIIAGMFSIVMSSADSFLNSASVLLVNDVIIPLKSKSLTTQQTLNTARAFTLLIGLIAVLLAVLIPNLLDILIFSYTFWSPVILFPLAMALLSIKANSVTFYASMIAGAVVTIIWSYVLQNPFELDGTIAGFLVNAVTFLFVRKMTCGTTSPKA